MKTHHRWQLFFEFIRSFCSIASLVVAILALVA